MTKVKLLGSVTIAAAMLLPAAAGAQGLVQRDDVRVVGVIPDQYICVSTKAAVLPMSVSSSAASLVGRAGGELGAVFQTALRGFTVKAPLAAVARIQANDASIAFCEQDQLLEIQGRVENVAPLAKFAPAAQSLPWGISRVGGGVNYTGSATAWVIDTGIDLDHPDLNVDTGRSRSFISGQSADDGNGHGTHVAGTIAARNNGVGVVGVAAGARVVAVKVLSNSGSGSNSGVIAGVDYVARTGRSGDVANMSLGGGISSALDQAVANAASRGIRFALAAGNSATNASSSSPGRTNGANIYTVSSFAQGDGWSSFSNYGNPPVDVSEPGSRVYSTYRYGGYATLSGTSMATPHLAGLLLLGPVRIGGYVTGDPDGNADPIGVR